MVGGGGRLHKAGTHQGPLLLRVAPHSFRCQVRANAAPGATVQHIARVSWGRARDPTHSCSYTEDRGQAEAMPTRSYVATLSKAARSVFQSNLNSYC
eukprot:COSAG01_NODE_14966_length_1390_cov_3.165763_2_plen_97_part_00